MNAAVPLEQQGLMWRYVTVAAAWTAVSSGLALLVPGDPTKMWFCVMVVAPMVLLPVLFFLAYRCFPRLRATMLSLDFTILTVLPGMRLAGIAMLSLAAIGAMSPTFALWAGGLDVLVALTALPMAYLAAARPNPPRRLLRAWHLVGLLDFAVAVPLVLITSPSSLRLIHDGPSSYPMLTFPLSFIPMVGVPLMTVVQITALLQLRTGHPLRGNALVHRRLDHPATGEAAASSLPSSASSAPRPAPSGPSRCQPGRPGRT